MTQWSFTNVLLALGALVGSAGFGVLIKTVLEHLRGRRKDEMSAAMELIETLRAHLTVQEKRIDKLENMMIIKDQIAEMKQSALRHKLANMKTIFASLMMALRKATSETLPDIINLIDDMRKRHEEEEVREETRMADAMSEAMRALGIAAEQSVS